MNIKIDDIQKSFFQKIQNFALNKDLINIKKALDEKANLIDVSNAFNKKVNRYTFLESLQNKM